MKQLLLFTLAIFFIISCSTQSRIGRVVDYGSPAVSQKLLDYDTFIIELYSQDKSYGFTERNPVMVGGGIEGPRNQRRFLNALAGPNGEEIEYYRIGSCCPFRTKNSEWGGMLDMYDVTYEGLKKSLILYINMYDSDTLRVPVGFKLRY